MAMVPVPASKAVIRDRGAGLEIEIPAKRNAFLVLFLSFWLVGWACGEVFAAKQLFAPKEHAPEVFLLAWLGAWTVAGAFAIYTWVWMVSGKERIILAPSGLTLKREVLGHGRARDFDLVHIANLRVAPQPYSPFDMSSAGHFWGLSGGSVAFDYGARTFRFGASLEEGEARKVVAAMLARQHGLGRSGAA